MTPAWHGDDGRGTKHFLSPEPGAALIDRSPVLVAMEIFCPASYPNKKGDTGVTQPAWRPLVQSKGQVKMKQSKLQSRPLPCCMLGTVRVSVGAWRGTMSSKSFHAMRVWALCMSDRVGTASVAWCLFLPLCLVLPHELASLSVSQCCAVCHC